MQTQSKVVYLSVDDIRNIETKWIGRDDDDKYHIGFLRTLKEEPHNKYILEYGKLVRVKPNSLKVY